MQIKVLSFNIHKGFDWTRRNLTIEKMRQAIIAIDADIVFLQEVVGEHQKHSKNIKNWLLQPQYEILADTIWPHSAYGKNAIHEAGHHGNAILSKFPIVSWNQQDISTNKFEQRGILYCNIEIPAGYQNLAHSRILHAYCLHLDLLHYGRKQQYHAIMKRLLHDVAESEPTIVAGDFNDWNQKASTVFEQKLQMQETFKCLHGHYAKTFPIYRPMFTLDRIYVKHLRIEQTHVLCNDHWKELSDHAALYAALSFT